MEVTYIWSVIYNVHTWTTEYENVVLEFTPTSNRVEQMLGDIVNCNVIHIKHICAESGLFWDIPATAMPADTLGLYSLSG